jgi:aryl-alcohol dehydrogenase-like predicted oxidoreductase
MDFTVLGRTGLQVSVMGLGGGGPSRLGQRTDRTEAESVAIVRQALDAGVNFFDTAEGYGTEEIVGKGIRGVDRDSVVLSTKKSCRKGMTPADVQASLEASLKRLGSDTIDIYNLHGVRVEDYEWLLAEIVPTFVRWQEQGKIRFIGITEAFNPDPTHQALRRALQDDVWDVMMVGFNILNQSARQSVLSPAIEKDIGIQVMFAVRKALSDPGRLKEVVSDLIEKQQLDSADIDLEDPLGFLVDGGYAVSLPDAAYRFCRDEPGTHVILSGTGNSEHLRQNIASFSRPPLSEAVTRKLKHIFRDVDAVTGQ